MIFNLMPVVYWWVITNKKQRHVDIDNIRKKPKESDLTMKLENKYMWEWLESTANYIIGNKGCIE